MITRLTFFFLLLIVVGLAQTTTGWMPVWTDEFNGAPGSPPDRAKWGYDLGSGGPANPGWGNNEAETYTNATTNAFLDGNGHLVIRALPSNGVYTSARLTTQSTFTFTYGKVEARMKLPYSKGIWPAFWMLGANTGLTWPANGEVDICENFGPGNNDVGVNHGTIHGPGYAGTGATATYALPAGETINADFHVFSIDWEPGSITFFVDGNDYLTVTPRSLPIGGQWVFDHNPMYLLVNLAVGGAPAPVGYPDATTTFPQDLLVDYVRVYQKVAITKTTPTIAPDGIVDAAAFSPLMAPGGIGTIYGDNLADGVYPSVALFDTTTGAFKTTIGGTSVLVNGMLAPLLYVAPTQLNVQLPWETPTTSAPVTVQVVRAGVTSFPAPLTLAPTAPRAFLDPATRLAVITGCTDGRPSAGARCTLWGNGFGPKNPPQADGQPAPASPSSLGALGVPTSCGLTIAGQPATILYCGAAPGELIDQLNFTYPANVPGTGVSVPATLTIGDASGTFMLPITR